MLKRDIYAQRAFLLIIRPSVAMDCSKNIYNVNSFFEQFLHILFFKAPILQNREEKKKTDICTKFLYFIKEKIYIYCCFKSSSNVS